VSLFTKVPAKENIQLMGQNFETSTIHQSWQVLTSTYFLYDGKFYHQTEGLVIGSSLAPVVANFYKEHFKEQA
jgi:hypothetical protein